MKNEEAWRPTKFVLQGARLQASRNPAYVAPSSRFICDRLAERYQRILSEHATGHLLDLGAGSVPLYGAYRNLVKSVTCVDWAKTLHSCAHIDLEADLNEPLPLESESYDTVLMTDVLEHVFRPQGLLAEVARLLRPGGKLLLSVPFLYWVHEAPHDYGRYTRFMLSHMCDEVGLGVHGIEATGGSPEVLLDLIGKHLAWSHALASIHSDVATILMRLPGLRAISRRSADWFPQGYTMVAQRKPLTGGLLAREGTQ